MNRSDGTDNAGRKGIAYDWQRLHVDEQMARLDAELAQLLTAADHP